VRGTGNYLPPLLLFPTARLFPPARHPFPAPWQEAGEEDFPTIGEWVMCLCKYACYFHELRARFDGIGIKGKGFDEAGGEALVLHYLFPSFSEISICIKANPVIRVLLAHMFSYWALNMPSTLTDSLMLPTYCVSHHLPCCDL